MPCILSLTSTAFVTAIARSFVSHGHSRTITLRGKGESITVYVYSDARTYLGTLLVKQLQRLLRRYTVDQLQHMASTMQAVSTMHHLRHSRSKSSSCTRT